MLGLLMRDSLLGSEEVVEVAKEVILAIKNGELGKSGCD